MNLDLLGRPVRLKNKSCPYCGIGLAKETSTVEHVVSRKFVPKTYLENRWNIILNACKPCNSKKADLEDDLSALTMHPDITGWRGDEPDQLRDDAVRKAKGSRSRSTGKLVGKSHEDFKINMVGNGFTMSFGMVGGPQIDQMRAYELAVMQGRAVLYWLTYDKNTKLGGRWIDGTKVLRVASARKTDWGNARMKGFMALTRDWQQNLTTETAKGCFKVSFRSAPDDRSLSSLAVEWNGTYRVTCLIGDESEIEASLPHLPHAATKTMHDSDGKAAMKFRTEETLDEADDDMFA